MLGCRWDDAGAKMRMNDPQDNPKAGNADRAAQAVHAVRTLSRIVDPNNAYRAFRETTNQFFEYDQTISLSRRGLEAPQYRITRGGGSDLDPWTHAKEIPILSSGLLSDLVWTGELQVIQDLRIVEDDPARPFLEGMRSLVAVPALR